MTRSLEEAVERAERSSRTVIAIKEGETTREYRVRCQAWEREQREEVRRALEVSNFQCQQDTAHPTLAKKMKKLWDYAWDEGHSEGYRRVVEIYEELVELVR